MESFNEKESHDFLQYMIKDVSLEQYIKIDRIAKNFKRKLCKKYKNSIVSSNTKKENVLCDQYYPLRVKNQETIKYNNEQHENDYSSDTSEDYRYQQQRRISRYETKCKGSLN
jgi:hypothetical protein